MRAGKIKALLRQGPSKRYVVAEVHDGKGKTNELTIPLPFVIYEQGEAYVEKWYYQKLMDIPNLGYDLTKNWKFGETVINGEEFLKKYLNKNKVEPMKILATMTNVKTGEIVTASGPEKTVMVIAKDVYFLWYGERKHTLNYFKVPSEVGHYGDDFLTTQSIEPPENLISSLVSQAYDVHERNKKLRDSIHLIQVNNERLRQINKELHAYVKEMENLLSA